jgi:hypothetical protein
MITDADKLKCITHHRWVSHAQVPDYLRLGWLALSTLDGTSHGIYAAHCIWLCGCKLVEPRSSEKEAAHDHRSLLQ